ncbi:LysR substrate-binding domain-containing protein [Muricoccus aerilatus]|uniref:LysR substrate-binding domain-containing protein n=1 Tax=Muricoccus aerilatus TaxID=452982 RepID=UPI0005C240B6|nr:LysR substrate-binding domain-containing protein [Roseomonas aerilata]
MVWRLPPLNAIRAFEAAGRHSSFSLAAQELHVTPGAVSRQIALLEATLGVPLFVRANREVRLTADGLQYLAGLTDALRRIDTSTRRLMEARQGRPLRVMCSANLATRWLFPQLRDFHAHFPNRHVLLVTSLTSAEAAFDFDQTDILIRAGTGSWPSDLVGHWLFGSELTPVCAPRLLRQEQGLREPADLRRQTLLISNLRPEGWDSWLSTAGLPDLSNFTVQRFESSVLAYEAAAEGLGVAIGEKLLVEDDLRKGRLVAPWPISQCQPENFYLIHQQQAESLPQLREFRDWILDR